MAKLISNPPAEYVRLQRAGLPLLRQAARNKFIEQAEIEAGKEPTFLVATQPGLYRGRICLRGDAVSASHSDVEFYPDERHAPVYEKFLRAGDYQGWKELVSLSRGNSCLLFAYQLAFSGLPCAAFGLDPPGALFCGPPGWGKSTACKIPSAIWGWDPTPNTRLGFGFLWRTKLAALENYAAGLRDPPRRIKARAIGIEQQGRHRARIEPRLTKPAFVACDNLRQIQVLAGQSDDELRQMVRRHKPRWPSVRIPSAPAYISPPHSETLRLSLSGMGGGRPKSLYENKRALRANSLCERR